MPADLLIYALVAAGLVFWLRNILGTRNGSERERPNPFTAQPDDKKPAAPGVSGARPAAGMAAAPHDNPMTIEQPLDRNMSVLPTAQAGLSDIAQADRSFETLTFLRGAQDAFVMIVEAFAKGDRESLKMLLAEPVFKAFLSAINAREASGQSAQVEIHAIRKAEIVAARLERRDAFITVRFVADETNILRDSADMILHGNPERITETIDVWTFVRDTKAREPGWLLIETSDEDAAHHEIKTVPDA
ncbi:MAG TPA: Tim44/TimA family putative adaptor protein [Micavibrio sp.]